MKSTPPSFQNSDGTQSGKNSNRPQILPYFMSACFILLFVLCSITSAADSPLQPVSKLLSQIEASDPSSGVLAFSIEVHPPFQTPTIWLIHTTPEKIVVSVERYPNSESKLPELSLTLEAPTSDDKTSHMQALIKRIHESDSSKESGLDHVQCFIKAKGAGIGNLSFEKPMGSIPDDKVDKGSHRGLKEFVAWLMNFTGVKPRPGR